MSASEKLKALGAVMDGPQTYGPEPIEASMAIDKLVDALDQIVAVVEAAEAVERRWKDDLLGPLPDNPVSNALDALEEVL